MALLYRPYKCHLCNVFVMELCVLLKSDGCEIPYSGHNGLCFNANSITIIMLQQLGLFVTYGAQVILAVPVTTLFICLKVSPNLY